MIKFILIFFVINQFNTIAFLQKFESIRPFNDEKNSPTDLSTSYDYIDTENDDNACLGNCKRLDFIVNFTEIGWEKWILHPKSFNAYYCAGSCKAPLSIQDNDLLSTSAPQPTDVQVTNHAQIMSIIEYNQNSNYKMTTCVPVKLQPLKIIYLNELGEIDTKEYENMIVKQCGCR